MSIIDSISEHFHEVAWPEHVKGCVVCAALNPCSDYEQLCEEGKEFAGWMQEV